MENGEWNVLFAAGRRFGGTGRRQASHRRPRSWLQIEYGWHVTTSDGVLIGIVAQIEGDKQDDIFDGLAVTAGKQVLYVPGEKVGLIVPGQVTVKIASAEIGSLEPFKAPPPETKWTPGKPSLTTRFSNWLRGKR